MKYFNLPYIDSFKEQKKPSSQFSFQINCFRAIDYPDLCHEYVQGHADVLRNYGLKSIASSNPIWVSNPMVYCIVAIRNNVMLGGIRIHKADGKTPLPMEKGVGKIDPSLIQKMALDFEPGCGEQCGLWNSSLIRGYGVSWILVNSSIAILDQLKISNLWGLASDYSMYLFTPAGFRIQLEFGNGGDFIYPSEDYIARVVKIYDCAKLPTSANKERKFIKQMRKFPRQSTHLNIKDKQLKCLFNLQLTNAI